MERPSSDCSPTSERSADCAPPKDCCSCARNTPVFATSRSSPSRRKASCAIRAPRNSSKRRGIARVKELLARGVNVVSSQDDVDDPYYPFGKPDQLEVALMMAHTAQLTLPHELEQVFDMVTVNAARAARLADYGIAPGNKADLVVVGAPSVRQALRLQPPRRHVIKNGVEIARTSVTQELRGP